ncbi:hypothetical protein BT96DRAFT_586943 [Gymnopus androsaceus JB14]|uniref:Uncharacterized protein n=1 Tax=Gymnopus androsaceus JB14 TaxID=1447944 RepID=A0A6A4IFC7_9AGAR|nr:hypothetical protein BT96DRAFT_586943 [Gymnopus androsaceus JB14]
MQDCNRHGGLIFESLIQGISVGCWLIIMGLRCGSIELMPVYWSILIFRTSNRGGETNRNQENIDEINTSAGRTVRIPII